MNSGFAANRFQICIIGLHILFVAMFSLICSKVRLIHMLSKWCKTEYLSFYKYVEYYERFSYHEYISSLSSDTNIIAIFEKNHVKE